MGAALATVIVISNVLDGVPVPEPVTSVAVTVTVVTEDVPVTGGVPLSTPVLLMLKPVGSAVAENVSGSVSGSVNNPLTSSGVIVTPSAKV